MEYISREAVNDLIEDIRNNHFILMSDRVTLALLKSKVAEIPAADVQPVRRGKWETEDLLPKLWRVCSCCGYTAARNYKKFKYCPNCGARMDGDTNG